MNRNGTPDVLQQPQFSHMDTMTVTDVDMNRNDTPDVLLQPQLGLAPQGFATLVRHGAAVNMGMTTVTGADMNRDGSLDVLPQVGIAHKGFAASVQYGAPANMRRPASGPAPVTEQPQQPRQVDLTMEEREDQTVLLIAVRDELLDRDEDPALVDLVYQLMDRLVDADTWEIADDARSTIPHLHHLWCVTARCFGLTIDDSDEDVSDEEDIGEDYGIAALVHGTPVRYTLVSKCGNQRRTAPRRRGA